MEYIRQYNGWEITKMGGYITISRYEATKGQHFIWHERLKYLKAFCNKIDKGECIPELYMKPLYH